MPPSVVRIVTDGLFSAYFCCLAAFFFAFFRQAFFYFFEFFLAHFFLAEAGIFTPASAVEATTVNAKDMASRVASRRISFKMLPLRESVCGGLPWPVPSMNTFSLPFGAVWRYAGVFVSDRRVTGRTTSGRALPMPLRPGGFALRGSSLKPRAFVVNVFG